jgi:hypothetical protein
MRVKSVMGRTCPRFGMNLWLIVYGILSLASASKVVAESALSRRQSEVRHLIKSHFHFDLHCFCWTGDPETIQAVLPQLSPTDAPVLVNLLSDTDSRVASTAGSLLARLGSDTLPFLYSAIVDLKEGSEQWDRVRQAIIKVEGSRSLEIERYIGAAAARGDGPGQLAEEKTKEVRRLLKKEDIGVLVSMLHSPREETANAVILLLGDFGGEAIGPLKAAAAAETSGFYRARINRALDAAEAKSKE